MVTENLFEARFRFVQEIARLGADVRVDGHHALVRGVPAAVGRAGRGQRHPGGRRAGAGRAGRRRRDLGRGRAARRPRLRGVRRGAAGARRRRRPHPHRRPRLRLTAAGCRLGADRLPDSAQLGVAASAQHQPGASTSSGKTSTRGPSVVGASVARRPGVDEARGACISASTNVGGSATGTEQAVLAGRADLGPALDQGLAAS